MKFLVPNYSCLQNPLLGGVGLPPPDPRSLCPQLNLLTPLPPFEETPWVSHWFRNPLSDIFGCSNCGGRSVASNPRTMAAPTLDRRPSGNMAGVRDTVRSEHGQRCHHSTYWLASIRTSRCPPAGQAHYTQTDTVGSARHRVGTHWNVRVERKSFQAFTTEQR